MTRYATIVDSPVGPLTLSGDDGPDGFALAGLHFGARETGAGTQQLAPAAEQLAEFFAGERIGFDLPLAPTGTPFQLRVWLALREIPYAETRTYAEIAEAIGSPTAMRAVGAANGRNPLSIVVPCHRVIGANGSLTGFGGGLEAKGWLLAHERAHAPEPVTLF